MTMETPSESLNDVHLGRVGFLEDLTDEQCAMPADVVALGQAAHPFEWTLPTPKDPIERLLEAVASLTFEVSTFSAYEGARLDVAARPELRHRLKLAIRDLGRATTLLASLKGGR